jgi:transketolase
MRGAFSEEILELAEGNPRVWLLTADVGVGFVEPFQQKFPDRFLNVGIAEQNMVGIAAGLAKSGKIPVCYSMATFLTMRAYEIIRSIVAEEWLHVILVGVGGANDYPSMGTSHNCPKDEDWTLMGTLASVTRFRPENEVEARLFLRYAVNKWKRPSYMKLSRF